MALETEVCTAQLKELLYVPLDDRRQHHGAAPLLFEAQPAIGRFFTAAEDTTPQGASVAYRSTAWTKILQTINSDRYIWERAAVKPITTEVYVERVLEAVIPGSEWRIQFELSPAEDTDGWILEHSTFGRAGVTTRVVY